MNHDLKPKPNAFVIGAAKAATTSLCSLLAQHPQAGVVEGKEPHYFSYDHNYYRGWEFYLSLFRHCEGKIAWVDGSTSYSRLRYHPLAAQRIKMNAPDAKIIYMVRHPLERMESAYVEHLCTPGGTVFSSINDAVTRQPMIIDSSRYGEVYEAYRQIFGAAQIKVVWFEEFVSDTVGVFQEVCRFLGIADTVTPALEKAELNARELAAARMARIGRGHVTINNVWEPTVRDRVVAQIRDDNCHFLTQMGRSKNHWGELF